MHAILGSCQPQQPLLLGESGRYTNNRSKEYREKKMKERLWAYTIHKTNIILLTKTMTWLCIPNLSPMFLRNWYLSAMERNTKRAKGGHLCVTPTICVFIITSHCLSDGICLFYDSGNLQVSSTGSSRGSHGCWLSWSNWFQAEGLVSYLF